MMRVRMKSDTPPTDLVRQSIVTTSLSPSSSSTSSSATASRNHYTPASNLTSPSHTHLQLSHYKIPTSPQPCTIQTLKTPNPNNSVSNLLCVLFSLFKMASSGFEGFEKRLELHFKTTKPNATLRNLNFTLLQHILAQVQCAIVSALGNSFFDAYVLSESSLFIYPTKLIIKTCGTTQLLKSVPLFILHSAELGLKIKTCSYTRGTFIFPKSQPFPHTDFKDEVFILKQSLPDSLRFRKSSIMPSRAPSHSWHVFAASTEDSLNNDDDDEALFTVEVCMTELDGVLAKKFFQKPGGQLSGDLSGKQMTEISGIQLINPKALICDYGFDPCGYSMNSVLADRYSTIHVTPEDGFSYASFECVGSVSDEIDQLTRALTRAVQVFGPATVSVSTTSANKQVWKSVAAAMRALGLKCRSCAVDEFPAAGTVVYQTFTSGLTRKSNS